MAGDEQQGATTAETAAAAAAPTAGDNPGQGSGRTPGQGSRQTPGQATGLEPGQGSDPEQGEATGPEPGQGSGPEPGQRTGQRPEPGQRTAPPPSAQRTDQRAGRAGGQPAGGRSRQRNRTVRGMILSLLVIGAAVAVIYTLFIPHDDKADPVQRVDYRVELITARRAAPYPVAAPVGLPDTWKPTSVTYAQGDGHAWHIGFLDPAGQYVAIEQSTSPAKSYAANVSQNAKNTGKTQQIDGKQWQRWAGGRYDALVRTEGGATTVVTGTASYTDLAKMAAALQFEKTKA